MRFSQFLRIKSYVTPLNVQLLKKVPVKQYKAMIITIIFIFYILLTRF